MDLEGNCSGRAGVGPGPQIFQDREKNLLLQKVFFAVAVLATLAAVLTFATSSDQLWNRERTTLAIPGVPISKLPVGDIGVVDVVYTWINGSHPRVIDLQKETKKNFTKVKVHDSRIREYGALRYSFRALEKYAPWVRNIYIVSKLGIKPDWLNPIAKNVHVIDEDELIPPGQKKRQTFNSNAVDINLGLIHGLSECFLYSNDDMFFYDDIQPEMYCTEDGLPIIRTSTWKTPYDINSTNPSVSNVWQYELSHGNALLNEMYNTNIERYNPNHGVYPLNRRSFHVAYNGMPQAVFYTRNAIIRTKFDIQTPFVLSNIAIESFGAPHTIVRNRELFYDTLEANTTSLDIVFKKIRSFKGEKRPKVICLNDALGDDPNASDPKKMDQIFDGIVRKFNLLFPEKSKFEI